MVENKHGLSRAIPAKVMREVRQRDGFGCIRCGSAIYTYEHVEPAFDDAKEHEADAITLLCAGCHDLVTRGLLAKATVKQLMLSPKCRDNGFSFGPFDVGVSWPSIAVGPVTLDRVAVILRVAGSDLLQIRPPEVAGGPFRLSARLYDEAGRLTLEIVENEWRSSAENWDVEVVGQRISIRSARGKISLVLRADPPTGLVVERLNMVKDEVQVEANESHLTVSAGGRHTFTAGSGRFWDCAVGLDVDPDGAARLAFGGSMSLNNLVIGSLTQPHVDKVGRNEMCPCGSETKFKRCCGRPATA